MRRALALICVISFVAPAMSLAAGETDDQIVALYTQGKFAECLAAIEPQRAAGPLNLKLLSASAHCKLSLGNGQGAREEYTQILSQVPLHADIWIDRAKCELAMGSLRDAEADFAIAQKMDAKAIEPFTPAYTTMLAAAKPLAVTEPIDSLWTKFVSAARDKPDQELMNLAMQIIRSRNATRHIGDEDFTRADAQFALVVRDKPGDVAALLDEAGFLINPAVPREAQFNGKTYIASVTVHDAEPQRALPLLESALKIDASNARAMALMAQASLDTGQQEQGVDWANKALAAGDSSVDVGLIHMLGLSNIAEGMTSRAAQLRQPTYRSQTHDEGDKRVTTTVTIPPSPEAIAEAEQLEANAAGLRQQATAPLRKLVEQTQSSAVPADQLTCAMANARLSAWHLQYDDAISWAQKAVAVDPFQPDMLHLLVDLGVSLHRSDLAQEAEIRLNNAQNPAAGRTLDGMWPLMQQGQFDQASAVISQADKIDPGSIHLACARFALAQEQGNLNDAICAARMVNTLNLARVTLDGRSISAKPPAHVAGDDVVLFAYTFTAIGRMLNDAGKTDAAIEHFNRAIAMSSPVPAKELSVVVPETALPNDPAKIGGATYLGAVVATAHWQCGELQVRMNKLQDAAPHLLAAAQMGNQTPQLPFMAYRCYKTAGLASFGGQIPDTWREKFRVWDMEHADVSPAASAQMDRTMLDLQIDQITRQINQGVGPDDLRALTAKRDALIAKRGK